MLPNQVLKYFLDIESVIEELDKLIELHENDYLKFQANFMATRTAERDLMIIGEAINQLQKIKPDINITGTKHIVGLRNLIVHSYDSIEPTTIWRILQKDIPVLKNEIAELRKK